MGMLDGQGCSFSGSKGSFKLDKGGRTPFNGKNKNGCTIIKNISFPAHYCVAQKNEVNEIDFWHRRLSHQ